MLYPHLVPSCFYLSVLYGLKGGPNALSPRCLEGGDDMITYSSIKATSLSSAALWPQCHNYKSSLHFDQSTSHCDKSTLYFSAIFPISLYIAGFTGIWIFNWFYNFALKGSGHTFQQWALRTTKQLLPSVTPSAPNSVDGCSTLLTDSFKAAQNCLALLLASRNGSPSPTRRDGSRQH